MAVNLTLEQVKGLLKKSNLVIVDEKRSGNNLGTVLKLANGCIINCWDKGTVNCQGKNAEQIVAILSEAPTSPIQNRKVFVVYGHDNNARTQLEAMLRRWDLEPMILDQLISSGQTIIEKLEEYTSKRTLELSWQLLMILGIPKMTKRKSNTVLDKMSYWNLECSFRELDARKSPFFFLNRKKWKNRLI